MKIRTLLWLCLFLPLFYACHHERIPADVMQPDTMVNFLTEAYLLEGFYAIESNYQYQEVAPQIQASYDSLLSKYHVTGDDFNRSVDYYTRHPELYDTIHARAIRRLDRQVETE